MFFVFIKILLGESKTLILLWHILVRCECHQYVAVKQAFCKAKVVGALD